MDPPGCLGSYSGPNVLHVLCFFWDRDVAKEVLKMRDEETKLRENMKAATETGA